MTNRDDISNAATVLVTEPWDSYALLDSGEGRKLERFGRYVLDRPDSQALWPRTLSAPEWSKASARFDAGKGDEERGRWSTDLSPWVIKYGAVSAELSPTSFRHVGIFPEQRVHWDFVSAEVKASEEPLKLLNLFGYTGMASLLPAAVGAKVTHVDASKKSVTWARENQERSGIDAKAIRWIVDDAARFVARERRREQRYDGIILDPPKYGRGPKGETWHLEEQLPSLLEDCRALLDQDSCFLVLTAYATHLSAAGLHRLVETEFGDLGGRIEHGEMALRDTGSGKILPTSMFVRWSRG